MTTTPLYVLAHRTAGRKWAGVAVWSPVDDTTCLAMAESAFRMAGFVLRDDTLRVLWGSAAAAQKNYVAGAAMTVVTATAREVEAWADLERAKLYIANGWDLQSQPEAMAAAVKHGLCVAAPSA